MRTSLRTVIIGLGAAAGFFLLAQLIIYFFMKSSENTPHRLQPKYNEELPKIKDNSECVGWDCDNKDDNNRPFHPRDIGLIGHVDIENGNDKNDNKLGKVKDSNSNKIVIKDKHLKGETGDKKNSNIQRETDDIKDKKKEAEHTNVPRGVLHTEAHKYKADADGQFNCLFSQEKIPIAQLNDDYCDCEDASDEPGTSACSLRTKTKFTCTFQVPDAGIVKQIYSSSVNDGVCDCCDGSDEFNGKVLHGLPDSPNVRRAPCVNTCQDLEKEAEKLNQLREEGRKIKQRYIKAGIDHKSSRKYGDEGEFYLLSEACFYRTEGKYEYTVCPFKEVFQGTDDRNPMNIGATPRWLSHPPGAKHVLMMEGGASTNCPNAPRSTKIEFTCGLADEITGVDEPETCRYNVFLTSPAAC